MAADLSYILRYDDDVLPLEESMTLGRHLDNDVVVAGEDVLDFHVRVDVDERGPTVHPIGDATININGYEFASAVGLAVGDNLSIGSAMLQVGVERQTPAQAEEWWLYEEFGDEVMKIEGETTVGRQGDCDLVVADDHVSRHHARLLIVTDAVWIQDLRSANGTRVNGEQIAGGRRLYHGDVVRFDETGYQLIGRGVDLTDARRPQTDDLSPLNTAAEVELDEEKVVPPVDTTEMFAAADQTLIRVDEPVAVSGAGAFLLGVSEPVAGQTFRLSMGRSVLGRGLAADIALADASVSSRHAELMVRPEGVTVTNLMATNGTFVNGEETRISKLEDGDVIRLGRVNLVFKDLRPDQGGLLAALRNTQRGLIIGAIAALALLVWLLF